MSSGLQTYPRPPQIPPEASGKNKQIRWWLNSNRTKEKTQQKNTETVGAPIGFLRLSYVVVASVLRFGVTLRQIHFQLGVHLKKHGTQQWSKGHLGNHEHRSSRDYVIPPLQHHFLRCNSQKLRTTRKWSNEAMTSWRSLGFFRHHDMEKDIFLTQLRTTEIKNALFIERDVRLGPLFPSQIWRPGQVA